MALYSVNAIILRRIPFGETDRIVTLYIRERGKIYAIAKGSRKAISRLGGPTEALSYGRYQLATGRNLDVITQADVKKSFPRIRSDLKRIALATYLVELVDKMVEERDPNQELFDLLLSALYLLERPNDPEKIVRMFELQMLKLLGYEPRLDACVRCRRTINAGNNQISPSLGGLVCRECGALPEDAIHISSEAIETMKQLLKADASKTEHMDIPHTIMDQITRAIRWHIRYRAERDLKSLDFLHALRMVEAE